MKSCQQFFVYFYTQLFAGIMVVSSLYSKIIYILLAVVVFIYIADVVKNCEIN